MAQIIADGRGGYIDSASGAAVDAHGRPLGTAQGTRPTTPYSNAAGGGFAGTTMTRDQFAAMLGIQPNDSRMDQYAAGQTPQGAWSIQQINDEIAKQSPGQRAAQTNSGGYISPWNAALVNQGPTTRDAQGNWNGQSFQDANTNMVNNIPQDERDKAQFLYALQQNGMGGDQTNSNSAYGQLSPGLSTQAIQGSANGNALGSFNDPMAYQIVGDLNRGLSIQQVYDRVAQAHQMYPGMPAPDMGQIQKYAGMMGKYNVGNGGATAGQGANVGTGVGTGTAVTPTPQTGTIDPSNSQQMRSNYMNSSYYNPYGSTNIYGIQNYDDATLKASLPGMDQNANNTGSNAIGVGANAAGASFNTNTTGGAAAGGATTGGTATGGTVAGQVFSGDNSGIKETATNNAYTNAFSGNDATSMNKQQNTAYDYFKDKL